VRSSPIRNLVVCGLAVAGWAVFGGVTLSRAQAAPAQGAQAAPAQGANAAAVHIFQDAVQNARTAYARLAGPQPRVVPGLTQYQDALAKLQAGQLFEALTAMQGAIRANGNSALYHGDMAAIQIALQSVDDASLELVRARQIQPQNQWYTVGLGAVKALRQQYSDASLNLDVAVSADSAIVDSVVAEAGVAWSWRGRRTAQAQAWALIATQRWPGTPEPWLRLATIYRQTRDTAHGMPAIQRYYTLRPADHVGQLLYAFYLYDAGRNDSALAMATAAAEDSAQRDRAAEVEYGVGARSLQLASADTVRAHQMGHVDTALIALARAKADANDELRPRVQLVLGYAQLTRVAVLDQQAERNRSCAPAMALDSLVTSAADNLRAGLPLDSARVAPILEATIPQYRTRVTALVRQVCSERRP
jgi:tetratricopeptide (TPR) repeat protein